ncbi:MAG: ATP-binding protein [Thalassolituus sp.]|jgi:signal transduction histidine kinase/CheY-like chemotaxis protein|uniref:ATP-binding protein n=1 Tax=Thalassolituus sp. TaxID=2030822 RepID=UPI0027D52B25|nr:ATP-binding protein [Thalassolituus sp.]MDQ4424618.1 ATP-binding protein [Thalassolituus sp.]MDQ4426030.1 ATP-binding protein [Thalassolituus sp.]
MYWTYVVIIALLATVMVLLTRMSQQRLSLIDLQREKDRADILWKHFPGVVAEIRPDGTIMSAGTGIHTPGADRLIKGEQVQNFLSGTALSTFSQRLKDAVVSRQPVSYCLSVDADDTTVHLRNELVPIVRDGRVISLLIISSDISELKEVEEKLKAEKAVAESGYQAKRRFLASMSHEIRTPLNAMLGALSLLGGTPLSTHQKNYLHNLQQGADHLLAIVNDALDVSRIESGHLQLVREEFDLPALAQRVLGIVQGKASEKRIALQLFCDDDVPGHVMGDPLRVSQILINLLNNALKFTDKGHVILRLVNSDKDGDNIRFSVEDTGSGIEPSLAPFLFDEYSAAHDERSRALGGTGLGLNICKRLVEAMGGNIGVASTPGIGSCFWMNIPLTATLVGATVATEQEYRGRTLWVADSFAVNRSFVMGVAGRMGMNVLGFDRLRDCISALLVDKPDVLVLSRRFFAAPDMRLQYDALGDVKLCVSCDESFSEDWQPPADLVHGAWAWPVAHRHLSSLLGRVIESDPLRDQVLSPANVRSEPVARSSMYLLQVLLVEDNPVNQKVLEQLLKRQQCQVVVRSSGAEALEYLTNNSGTELVIMDRHMPGMDGIETMRRIHGLSGYETLPVVALSGDALEEQKLEFLQAGAIDYLLKPVHPQRLKQLVDSFRSEHRRAV